MKIGYKQLLDQAMLEIETLTVEESVDLHEKENVQFVDLRDIRELKQEGKIPGTYHMPRGMLEFWIDPESPYFKNVFSEEKKFVFYCKSGWRSALATQTAQRMGLQSVCHIGGGFDAWKESGAEVEKID